MGILYRMYVLLIITLFCFQTAKSEGNCTCGQSQIKIRTKRIVNGTVVPEGKYPWMAYLGCGGSFITNQHVLTAAHCKGWFQKGSKIIYGTNDKNNKKKIAIVSEFHIHPEYDEYDIAILTLSRPIKFSKKVQPICLPTWLTNINEGVDGIVAGWGRTNIKNDPMAGMLRETKLKIIQDFKGYHGGYGLCKKSGGSICGQGSLNKPSKIDYGDSGSPFIVQENGRMVQIGVATGWCISEGKGCSSFVKVSDHLGWIKKYAPDAKETVHLTQRFCKAWVLVR